MIDWLRNYAISTHCIVAQTWLVGVWDFAGRSWPMPEEINNFKYLISAYENL